MSLPEIRLHLRADRRAEASAALLELEVAAAAAVAPYESRHARELSHKLQESTL